MATVAEFLSVRSGYGAGAGAGDGYGDGDGYGYGAGDGAGAGDGYGCGDGYGYGDGAGSGYGAGCGYDVKQIDGKEVNDIDGVQTIITSVKANIARGFTLNADLSLSKCFIAKAGDFFAHGATVEEAIMGARAKQFQALDEGERIAGFWAEFDKSGSYPARLFFEWHGKLTGSCEYGRWQFVKDKGIDLESSMTVAQFVMTTQGSYGSETIQKLSEGLSDTNRYFNEAV